jgi:cyanophycinase
MSKVFLIGGGRNEASYVRTYWRFVRAAVVDDQRLSVAIVIPVDARHTEEDRKQLQEDALDPFVMFEPVSREECHVIFASREEPLTAERLQAVQATGVYVHGTRMSACRDALCTDLSWLQHLREQRLPYVGHAAGAAIAAERAVLGGWLIALQHFNSEIAPDKTGDGIEYAEVVTGLGLVPFVVETRATQHGTLSRLTHLVAEGALPGGWALDESAMLEIHDVMLRVHGPNTAYRLRSLGEGAVRTDVFHAGTALQRADW